MNEAFRVLKPGGVFAVADVTVQGVVPDEEKKNMDSWSACLTGAIPISEYRSILVSAGFEKVEVERLGEASWASQGRSDSFAFINAHIKARKPSVLSA